METTPAIWFCSRKKEKAVLPDGILFQQKINKRFSISIISYNWRGKKASQPWGKMGNKSEQCCRRGHGHPSCIKHCEPQASKYFHSQWQHRLVKNKKSTCTPRCIHIQLHLKICFSVLHKYCMQTYVHTVHPGQQAAVKPADCRPTQDTHKMTLSESTMGKVPQQL